MGKKKKKETVKSSSEKTKMDQFVEIGEEKIIQFETGANRGTAPALRYDLISPTFLERLAATCDEGQKKYGAGNYLKGIPCSNLLNHVYMHLEKWKEGNMHEDDLAHAVWNIMAIMHFEKHNPSMLDDELIYQKM